MLATLMLTVMAQARVMRPQAATLCIRGASRARAAASTVGAVTVVGMAVEAMVPRRSHGQVAALRVN